VRERRRARTGDGGQEGFRLETSALGVIDKLEFRTIERRKPGPGEVEVEVAAAGLNFSDVMKALGLYPGLEDGPIPLGIECAGRVAAVGEGVKDLEPGAEVVAIAPFSFASHVTTPSRLVAPKPAGLSFEEAATIPIAFLTAHYALEHLGQLCRGERVLVRSATGGVGLAAIQLARRAGAEIYATAGTPAKRNLLLSLGIEQVMDSRSTDFADEIMVRTAGEGVDLVLNSLAGEAISKGLGVLRDNGRFLEIGKRDIYQNSRVGLRPFRKNLSFMGIDLDRELRRRPELLAGLFQQLLKRFDEGTLRPLVHRVFPASNVSAAFRYMAQAKHVGKVVISLSDQTVPVAPAADRETSFAAGKAYLITGGLGGFGLILARWMVDRGARHLVLMGRAGARTAEAQAAVEQLRAGGAEVIVARADVSRADDVARVLGEIEGRGRPLGGVMHAAMVLDDSLVPT
jgi:NADPH:quinone reductase-like Zn-dependent oxidoreductase